MAELKPTFEVDVTDVLARDPGPRLTGVTAPSPSYGFPRREVLPAVLSNAEWERIRFLELSLPDRLLHRFSLALRAFAARIDPL